MHQKVTRLPPNARDNNLLGLRSLLANSVYDARGRFVGKLEEVVIDARMGCIRHAVVAVGGIMGVGRRRLAVPWSALMPDADHRRCIIDTAQMELTAVAIPKGDPWLQHRGAARLGRSLGTAD
jgi:sporulation protein YlmC with PRC-barrel domain